MESTTRMNASESQPSPSIPNPTEQLLDDRLLNFFIMVAQTSSGNVDYILIKTKKLSVVEITTRMNASDRKRPQLSPSTS